MQELSTVGKFHFEPPFTSFDHLVGLGEQCRRNIKAEGSRGPEVDYQLKAGRLHHRKLGWFFAFQDTARVDAYLATALGRARRVADEAPCINQLATGVHGGE